MTRLKVARENPWRAREELTPWAEMPERRWVRMEDLSVWWVEGFRTEPTVDGVRIVRMHATFGGQIFVGPVPNVDARRIVRHDDEDLDERASGKPWRFVDIPHGVGPNRGHLLHFHGIYVETTRTWQELTKLHIECHVNMSSGNGLVPHIHREAPEIVWT